MSTYLAMELVEDRLDLIPWSIIDNAPIEIEKHRVVAKSHLRCRDGHKTQEAIFCEREVLRSSMNYKLQCISLSMHYIRVTCHVLAGRPLTGTI